MSAVPNSLGTAADRLIFTGDDALQLLCRLPDEYASLLFLDPPFNLGKHYGGATSPERDDPDRYLQYMRRVLRESARVLDQGGSLFLYHLPYWASRLAPALHESLDFRHWIAVSMKAGFVRGRRLYPAHYALLYFSKGEPAAFERPRLQPRRCRKCGETVNDYGGYLHIIEEKGINLSDIWDDLSPVRHKSTKTRGANELSLKLTDRIVRIAGGADAMMLDPFAGSGSMVVSALRAGMRCHANDLDPAALDQIKERVAPLQLAR